MCVQYIGGCSVHRRDTMITSGGYHEYIGGYHEYIREISWVHRGVFSTSEGYHAACGRIPWVHRGMFSTLGGYHEYIRRYHEYIVGISWCMWESKLIKVFQFLLKTLMYWTSPDVLMISPQCTHVIPRCTRDIPPMHWTPPDVLYTLYTGWAIRNIRLWFCLKNPILYSPSQRFFHSDGVLAAHADWYIWYQSPGAVKGAVKRTSAKESTHFIIIKFMSDFHCFL